MRTEVIAGLLFALLCAPLWAGAQQAPKMHRVAYLATTSPLSELIGPDPANPALRALVHGLRDLGYLEGRNLVLDIRSLEGKWERTEEFAADFARLGTDVIVLATYTLVPAVRKVTGSIPIVMLAGGDMIGSGLVQSYARPGGNITGLRTDVDTDVEAKRLELMLELAPRLTRIAYLGSLEDWEGIYGQAVQAAARRRQVQLFHAPSTSKGFAGGFAAVKSGRADAFLVAHGAVPYAFRREIGEFAATSGVPSSCAHSEAVAHGCLMSYGADLPDVFRRVAGYVDRILKGTNAGDLPIEQPTKFELVINLRTAKRLGVTIPRSILLRADRVIE
jgi:putative ABC transport system substrate-binding protein